MAPARVMVEEGTEIKFAQKLAGNEKEGRDKALRKLKKWIQLRSSPDSSESAFSELELLKLWKGLFYCMWMSDKPLVQEQLAEELSRLVHLFPHRQDGVTFCSTFFLTMAREWHAIDVIRREKFMMLVRRVLRQALSLLLPADSGAGDGDGSLGRLSSLCAASFARREDPATLPLGLQLHLVEIFLEEVAKVGGGSLTPSQLAVLLQPFIQVLKVSKQSALRRTVTDSVFYSLMRQSDAGIAHEALLNGEQLPSDSEDDCEAEEPVDGGEPALDPRAGGVDVLLPRLRVDAAGLAEQLVAAGADPGVRQSNRAALYRLAQQFRELSEARYPLTLRLPARPDSDSDISDEELQAAVMRLQSTKQRLNKDSRKNQKAQKRLRAEPEEESEEPQPKRKKKKLKSRLLPAGVIDTGEELLAEAERAAPGDGEPSEDPQEQPTGPPRTLKEKRRQKLRERRQAELERQSRRRDRLEAKRAKLNGDVTQHTDAVANGTVVNGHHDPQEDEPAAKVEEGSSEASEEVQEAATPSTTSKKKKKKKRVVEENSLKTDSIPVSIADTSSSPKAKKKKKKSNGTPEVTETPAPAEEASPGVNTAVENGTPSPPRQKKAKKRKSAAGGTSEGTAAAPSGAASPATPRPAFDWSLGAEDSWDEPSPAPTPSGEPAKQAAVARFVPARPVPAFVKLRPGKKAGKTTGQGSPATPRTPASTKKVIINLAENKAQGFKEHLITVRNSPQVPHNPDLRPAKGLLKPSPAPAAHNADRRLSKGLLKTPPAPAAGAKTGRRRSRAADFFSS